MVAPTRARIYRGGPHRAACQRHASGKTAPPRRLAASLAVCVLVAYLLTVYNAHRSAFLRETVFWRGS